MKELLVRAVVFAKFIRGSGDPCIRRDDTTRRGFSSPLRLSGDIELSILNSPFSTFHFQFSIFHFPFSIFNFNKLVDKSNPTDYLYKN